MRINKLACREIHEIACRDIVGRFLPYVYGKRYTLKISADDLNFARCYGFILLDEWEVEKPIKLINVWFNKEKGVTVVKWSDGTITKVTLQGNDEWDEEKAIALCYMKKVCGNNSSYNNIFNKYIIEEKSENELGLSK